MKNAMKGAAIAALAALGLGLSACGDSSTSAREAATPDAADLTAAAIDQEAAAAAPVEPTPMATESGAAPRADRIGNPLTPRLAEPPVQLWRKGRFPFGELAFSASEHLGFQRASVERRPPFGAMLQPSCVVRVADGKLPKRNAVTSSRSYDTSDRRSSAGGLAPRAGVGLAVSVQEFIREPLMVGSAFPASRWLVKSTLAPLDWSRIRLLVEYGPGTGGFTRAVLDRLDPCGRMIALETGTDFVRHLRATIHDPRLEVIEAPAQNVLRRLAEYGPADCIVSGIPFSTLAPGEGEELLRASSAALAADGTFVAYQMRKNVVPLLRQRFQKVRHAREWRNIPPCHLYWASGKY